MPGHLLSIVKGLTLGIVVLGAFVCLLGNADRQRRATLLPNGQIEFTPNRRAYWSWPVVVVYMAFAAIDQGLHTHGKLLNILMTAGFGYVAWALAISFPTTILVSDDGLEQVSWLWRTRRIRWTDIVEINTGQKSGLVTITGADGTKIVHNSQLPDRGRLLIELKNRCGENLPSDFPREPLTV
ncbi:MAG: PH domain-containing protein [Acidobacteriaceae bacterium]